jgi:hypothetical protein
MLLRPGVSTYAAPLTGSFFPPLLNNHLKAKPMTINEQFKKIFVEVEQLTFSDINAYLLLKYADEACSLALKKEAYPYTAVFLPRILKIKDGQIRPLLEKNLFPKEKRQRFYDSKTKLESNLKQCFS